MNQIEDAPLQRMLKIGNVTVGLIGLDRALNAVLKEGADRGEAIEKLFTRIAEQNYIPQGKEDAYREALAREYDKLQGTGEDEYTSLVIRILGPGCVSCNKLQVMVLEAMAEMQVAADIFQVHDADEIGRYGVTRTPALIINNDLKCAGRMPTPAQVEAWLREYL
jgi:hypothetical protein